MSWLLALLRQRQQDEFAKAQTSLHWHWYVLRMDVCACACFGRVGPQRPLVTHVFCVVLISDELIWNADTLFVIDANDLNSLYKCADSGETQRHTIWHSKSFPLSACLHAMTPTATVNLRCSPRTGNITKTFHFSCSFVCSFGGLWFTDIVIRWTPIRNGRKYPTWPLSFIMSNAFIGKKQTSVGDWLCQMESTRYLSSKNSTRIASVSRFTSSNREQKIVAAPSWCAKHVVQIMNSFELERCLHR